MQLSFSNCIFLHIYVPLFLAHIIAGTLNCYGFFSPPLFLLWEEVEFFFFTIIYYLFYIEGYYVVLYLYCSRTYRQFKDSKTVLQT